MKKVIATLLLAISLTALAVPSEVQTEVSQFPEVYRGGCQWQHLKAPCRIFYNEPEEVVYLVIYTLDTRDITHVVKVKDGKEEVLWVNPRYTT